MALNIPFPDSERIVFDKNPLTEVVCQIRFPQLLIIQDKNPVEFQEAIRDKYPILEIHEGIELDLRQGMSIDGPPTIRRHKVRAYDFTDSEERWKVLLQKDSLSLSCYRYTEWSEFEDRIKDLFNVYLDIYKHTPVTRCGLRYINFIRKESLGLSDKSWAELLSPNLLSGMESLKLSDDRIVELNSVTKLRLSADAPEQFVRFSHGIAEADDGDQGYRIDSDFSIETLTELKPDDVINTLGTFSEGAGRAFRWSISKTLRSALAPRE